MEKQIVTYNLKREPIVYSVLKLNIVKWWTYSFCFHFWNIFTWPGHQSLAFLLMSSEYATCTVHAVSNKGFLHLVISKFLLCWDSFISDQLLCSFILGRPLSSSHVRWKGELRWLIFFLASVLFAFCSSLADHHSATGESFDPFTPFHVTLWQL